MNKDRITSEYNNKFEQNNFMFNTSITSDSSISALGDTLNNFGLDLTNPELIRYEHGTLQIEVIGGINDYSTSQLKVGLKVQKLHNSNPIEIHRSQSIDLFNDNQIEYLVTGASQRIKVVKTDVQDAVYSLIEKLDSYKRYKLYASSKEVTKVVTSNKLIKETKAFLKESDLLERLESLFITVGIPAPKLAVKLFIISLSRLTDKPMHTILQGNVLLSNQVCKQFATVVNDEEVREVTSLSPTVIGHAPHPNYWSKKLLVIHQLEGTLNQKNSSLEEYMKHEHLNRYVTQANQQNGTYQMVHKHVDEVFAVLGYTSRDFHTVFTSSSVVCLPLGNTTTIKEKIAELELKQYAGLIDRNAVGSALETLKTIQRLLEPKQIVNPWIEQLDIQTYFNNDVKKIKQFMQITNLITMLHQFQLTPKRNKELYYEVQPEHMLMTLELFKELWITEFDELYYQVEFTFKQIKNHLKKNFPEDCQEGMFTEKELIPVLKVSPPTINRHVQKLLLYNRLKRVAGNNRTGYYYAVVDWSESGSNNTLETFREALSKLINKVCFSPLKAI